MDRDLVTTLHKNSLLVSDSSLSGTVLGAEVGNGGLLMMKRAKLKEVAQRAISGDIDDMLIIGILYGSGFGLPRNNKLCRLWQDFAVLKPSATASFKKAANTLLSHVDSIESDFVYPAHLDTFFKSVSDEKFVPTKIPAGSYIASPWIAGVPFTVVYKNDDRSGLPHLYDCRLFMDSSDNHTTKMCLDLSALSKLGFPKVFGEIRNKECIPRKDDNCKSYSDRIAELISVKPDYFVISGFLTINSDDLTLVREIHGIAKYSAAVQLFLDTISEPRIPFTSDPSLSEVKLKIQQLNSTIGKATKKSSKLSAAKAEYKDLVLQYRSKTAEEKTEKAMHKVRYLENVLVPVSTSLSCLVVTKTGSLNRLPVTSAVFEHLQSLGFTTPFTRNGTVSVSFSEETGVRAKSVKELSENFSNLPYVTRGIVLTSVDRQEQFFIKNTKE